jgi:hypothetical protein
MRSGFSRAVNWTTLGSASSRTLSKKVDWSTRSF